MASTISFLLLCGTLVLWFVVRNRGYSSDRTQLNADLGFVGIITMPLLLLGCAMAALSFGDHSRWAEFAAISVQVLVLVALVVGALHASRVRAAVDRAATGAEARWSRRRQ